MTYTIALAVASTCGACGLLALTLPHVFQRLARFMGKWVETRPIVPLADKRIDIDDYVLQHTRFFGGIVTFLSLVLAILMQQFL